MDHAFCIVGNDHRLRAVRLCIVRFFGERNIAAVDGNDLAGKRNGAVYRRIICGFAAGIDINIVISTGYGRNGGISVSAVLPFRILGVEHLLTAVENERHAFGQGVLRRGRAHTVDERSRRAAGMEKGIFRIQLMRRMIVECIGVARRDRNDHVIVDLVAGKRIQDRLILAVIGPAGRGRAERKVRRICAENDRILQGGKIVGIIRAAARPEDFHDQDLGIRGHADRLDRLRGINVRCTALDKAVSCGNAGHV